MYEDVARDGEGRNEVRSLVLRQRRTTRCNAALLWRW